MARSAPSFSSFTAGEISPRLEGRTDLAKYSQGLSDLTNMVVMPHGGVTRRPGTEFIGQVKDNSKKTRLIPFQFKTSDTYILEFGHLYMRVYRDGQQVLSDPSLYKPIHSFTIADPGVITAGGLSPTTHGFSNDEEIVLIDISGNTTLSELNNRSFLVKSITSQTLSLTDLFGNDIDTSSFTAYNTRGWSRSDGKTL